MSHPQPPQRQPTGPETEEYAKTVRTVAAVAVFACPVLALLPPRKVDVYTLGLVGAFGYSASYLVRDSTGRSIWQHVSRQQSSYVRGHQVGQEQRSIVGDLQTQSRSNAVDAPTASAFQRRRDEWKIERQKEINEELEEGKGFGDMIMDQIWEVWNWGKPKENEDEKDD